MEKKCIIINGNASYTLKVDGQSINFQGAHNAEYFIHHYAELGYMIEFNRPVNPPSNRAMEKPKQLQQIDLESLRKVCSDYMDFIDNDEEYHEDNDYDHCIFEQAMETLYGPKVWDWINNRQR